MYKLIGHLGSRSFRVAWLLEELGLPYELNPATPGSPDARAANATGKVPVLETEDGMIADSVAIMTFLADRHGGFTHPAGSFPRAQQDAMTQLIVDELDAVLWAAARHRFVLPEDKRVPDVKASLAWEFDRNIGRLDTRLADAEFLAGDTPTIPDLLLVHCVNWSQSAKFDYDAPSVQAHHARMTARPAYQKLIQLRG